MYLPKYLLLSHRLLSRLFELHIDLFLHQQTSPRRLLSEQRQKLGDVPHGLFRILICLKLLSKLLRRLLTLQFALFVMQMR